MRGAGWLFGWKAIAEHLGMSVSTAKRYNRILSMPVLNGQGNSKIAILPMIDLWIIEFNRLREKEKNG